MYSSSDPRSKLATGSATTAGSAAPYGNEPASVAFAAAEYVLSLPADVIAIGPGLGRGEGVATFARELLEHVLSGKSRMP